MATTDINVPILGEAPAGVADRACNRLHGGLGRLQSAPEHGGRCRSACDFAMQSA